MTNERPYRAAMSVEAAIAEIKREGGRQFDLEIVGVFLSLEEFGKAA